MIENDMYIRAIPVYDGDTVIALRKVCNNQRGISGMLQRMGNQAITRESCINSDRILYSC